MHSWKKTDPEIKDGIRYKNWECKKCGCEKTLGVYKFAEPSYNRSGINYDRAPVCVEMGRRSNEPLD